MSSTIVFSDKNIKLTNGKHPLLMSFKKTPLASLPAETENNVGHVH